MEQMRTDTHVGIFDLIIFLGIFQGILISWFFLKNSQREKKANLYQGLLLLFLSLAIFEELLNNTGYIVQVLPLTNFSEPLNFTFAPLFYLYVRSSLYPEERQKVWGHFIIALFWLFYMYFVFVQPNEAKYNSYIQTKHPDWGYLDVVGRIDEDPLGIRYYTNHLTLIQFIVYMFASIVVILKKFRALEQPLFKTDNELLITLRNTTIHFLVIIGIFIASKAVYGMRSDIGGYWIASYISFMIYATSYSVLNRSDFFNQPASFLAFPVLKYKKSSLSEEEKEKILERIKSEMVLKQFYLNNLASLSGLAKLINESSHHVSQVINEKLNMNFFELLADYRVEHAKKLIREDTQVTLTVEELAETVGYNSKSAFNTAFKKLTSQTPSEYRKSLKKE
jgi:AraC-like DNA-binding protein